MRKKIYSLSELKELIAELKKSGKRIVHCHGCFDLLHHGHIKHFKAAKQFGDVLVVTVTEDKFVNKGPDRPFFNQSIRAENLAALEIVDYVAINHSQTAVPAIETIKADFYVKGQDYKQEGEDITGGILIEKEAVEKNGGKLLFTEEIQFSSSSLINENFDQKDDSALDFLKQIKEKYSFEHFNNLFERISKSKVLIIGDIIIDEYQFVQPLGKSSKSATITAKKLNAELYAGGVLAVANHVADFVDEVHLIAGYGINGEKNYLDFIKENLHEKVNFHPVFTPNRPTVLKSRLVEKTFKHKLFEVIEIDDSLLEKSIVEMITKEIDDLAGKTDFTLVSDFGHGFLCAGVIDKLSDKSDFIAVNAQTNSANQGYNLLTKYKNCNYFSIDKEEAHLAAHDKFGNIFDIQCKLQDQTNADVSSITLGVKGTQVMGKNEEVVTAPIFNKEIVDTIGAGDAYLSISSLLAYHKCSLEEIAFIGNAVGAMAVKILGNKSFIKRTDLLKYVKTLLA